MNDSLPATPAATDELPTVPEYRPLSVTAVLALLLGLAAALAIITPALAIVPLAAIVTGILALRGIAADGNSTSGRSLAVTGICLATMFLGWGLARHFHYQDHVRQQAREFADDWLQLLSTGDLARAYQLHISRESRQDAHAVTPPQIDGEPDLELADFFRDPAVQKFLETGPNVRFRFEEFVLQSRDGLSDQIVLRYTFDAREGRLPLWLTVRRTFPNNYRAADWEMYTARHRPPGE